MKIDTEKLKPFVKYLKNKFVIATAIFAVWITFFDQNNLLSRISSVRTLHQMEKQKEYYAKKIEEDALHTNELLSDDENLEKFAREQYLMKKPDEDVFVIVEK